MKTLVLGDIHGRTIWKDIVKKENPDFVIFLGDYVSTHGLETAEEQLDNLEEILQYKEENPDKVILLRGNHDTQHLGYYWAECSGWNPKVWQKMSQPEFKERFLNLTQWIYISDELKTIFSHAGISTVWMDKIAKITDVHEINNLEPSWKFGFCDNNPFDCCGESETQPPTWIRPYTLATCNVPGWDQVVGHTPQPGISKMYKNCKGKHTIWLCDSLGYGNYLIIEGGEFNPKHYEEESKPTVLR